MCSQYQQSYSIYKISAGFVTILSNAHKFKNPGVRVVCLLKLFKQLFTKLVIALTDEQADLIEVLGIDFLDGLPKHCFLCGFSGHKVGLNL